MSGTTQPGTKRALHWGHCSAPILGLAALGAALALWEPLWFAPPNFVYTSYLYGLLTILWLPVFIMCLLRRPEGRPLTPIMLLVIGTAVTLVFGVPPFLSSVGLSRAYASPESQNCAEETLPENTVRYTCTLELTGETQTILVFEGGAGSALVRLVEWRREQG